MIAVLTLCFVLSAVSGVEKGIQFLSNANAIAAAVLVFFLFVVGPTVFIMGTFTTTMGDYLTHLPSMAFNTGVYDSEARAGSAAGRSSTGPGGCRGRRSSACSSRASPRAAPSGSS